MPTVQTKNAKKEFPYTEKGIVAAKKSAKKPGHKLMMKKKRMPSSDGYVMSK